MLNELSADQRTRCVRSVTVALGAYVTEPNAAEERARNIVTALMFVPPTQRERLTVVATCLHTRRHCVREFWVAVNAVELAFVMGVQPDNGARFGLLVSIGYSGVEASKYLQDNGWTLPEGVVAA